MLRLREQHNPTSKVASKITGSDVGTHMLPRLRKFEYRRAALSTASIDEFFLLVLIPPKQRNFRFRKPQKELSVSSWASDIFLLPGSRDHRCFFPSRTVSCKTRKENSSSTRPKWQKLNWLSTALNCTWYRKWYTYSYISIYLSIYRYISI